MSLMISVCARHYYSNNILVFGALFTYSCCSILYSFATFYSEEPLLSSLKNIERKRMLYNFEEMQACAHLDLYSCVIHSEYIWSLNDIGVYMYGYG